MDELCNKDNGSKGGHVISSKRTQEILQAFGLQLVNDPADSKASVQQGHETRFHVREATQREAKRTRGKQQRKSRRDSKQNICQLDMMLQGGREHSVFSARWIDSKKQKIE